MILDRCYSQLLLSCSIMSHMPSCLITRRIAPGLWDKLSRSSAGLGSSPTSIFAGLQPAKISECGHTRIAYHFVHFRCMAQKNGDPYSGTSVSLASLFISFYLHNITQCNFTFHVIVFERCKFSYYRIFNFMVAIADRNM